MGLFGLKIVKEKKKNKDGVSPISGYGFDDEDRSYAANLKRMKAERARIEHEMKKLEMEQEIMVRRYEIEQLKRDMYGDDDDDDDEGQDPMAQAAMQILLSRFMGGQQPPQQQTPSSPTSETTAAPTMSDEEIKEMIEQLPKHYKLAAKAMKDDKLREVLKAQGFDEETAERAIKIFRGKK